MTWDPMSPAPPMTTIFSPAKFIETSPVESLCSRAQVAGLVADAATRLVKVPLRRRSDVSSRAGPSKRVRALLRDLHDREVQSALNQVDRGAVVMDGEIDRVLARQEHHIEIDGHCLEPGLQLQGRLAAVTRHR